MENSTSVPTVISSSHQTSTTEVENEKTLSTPSSRPSLQHEKETKEAVGTTPLAEVEALNHLSDEPQYPSGMKLGIIMTSLGLSVFLMALVSPVP